MKKREKFGKMGIVILLIVAVLGLTACNPKKEDPAPEVNETNCPSPYRDITSDNICIWSCGVGTIPIQGTNVCGCQEGYIEDQTDEFGRLTCIEKPFCPGPYKVLNADNNCVWTCGEGTAPIQGTYECSCKEGYSESGVDEFGRRTCTANYGLKLDESNEVYEQVQIDLKQILDSKGNATEPFAVEFDVKAAEANTELQIFWDSGAIRRLDVKAGSVSAYELNLIEEYEVKYDENKALFVRYYADVLKNELTAYINGQKKAIFKLYDEGNSDLEDLKIRYSLDSSKGGAFYIDNLVVKDQNEQVINEISNFNADEYVVIFGEPEQTLEANIGTDKVILLNLPSDGTNEQVQFDISKILEKTPAEQANKLTISFDVTINKQDEDFATFLDTPQIKRIDFTNGVIEPYFTSEERKIFQDLASYNLGELIKCKYVVEKDQNIVKFFVGDKKIMESYHHLESYEPIYDARNLRFHLGNTVQQGTTSEVIIDNIIIEEDGGSKIELKDSFMPDMEVNFGNPEIIHSSK